MRDRTVGDTFYMFFTTRAFATGVPTALAGTPVVSAYEDNSATQITAGITLGVDHDSVVGLNLLTIVATGGNGYETGKDYSMVITTGTVGGVSVVGEVVGEFSLDLSAALKAVDALNDVAATDIVSSGAITTSGGAVSTVTTCTTTTTNTDMRGTDSALLAANINLTGGAVDTVTTLTNKTGFSLASTGLDAIASTATGMVEIAKAIWDRVLTGATHNINNSAGRRLRQVSAIIFSEGAAQSGGNNSIQLESSAVTTNDQFRRAKVIIIGGTGTGQEAIITSSVASTDTLTITPAWLTNPDATSEYEIIPAQTHSTVRNGGYDNARVYLDSVNGTSGVEIGVNATSSNPSSVLADAKTIADIEVTKVLQFVSGSNFTMAQSFDGYELVNMGTGAIIVLDGQSISGTLFNRMRIQGNDDGSNTQRTFYDNCRFDGNTLGDFFSTDCAFSGDIVFAQASNTYTVDIPRPVSTSQPTFDFALLTSVDLICTRVSCDIELKQLAATSTAEIHGDGGNITINANCTGGTLTIYGNFTLTDNAGGAVTVVDDGRIDTGQITVSAPTAVQNRAEMDSNSTQLAKLGTPAADISADIAAVKVDTAAILVDTGTTLPGLLREQGIAKNATFSNFEFLMVLASDGETPATGLTVTGQRSIDGAAFATVGGTIAEVSNGIYQFDALAADTNGDVITWRFSSATALDRFVTIKTVQ